MIWLMLIFGLVMLLVSGELLVRGAVNFSIKLGLSPMLVSLTIVAFGTSAPELLVAVQAALAGSAGIALGNVVGSNIANVFLVLGLPLLLSSINPKECDARTNYFVLIASTHLFLVLSAFGVIGFWSGVVLLCGLFGFLIMNFLQSKKHIISQEDLEGSDPSLPMYKILTFLGLGLVGLPVGADILVSNATTIASNLGVSEEIIGLTLIALGTSLPELAAVFIAALKKQTSIIIGSVIGSNIFNILGVIGVTTLFSNISVPRQFMEIDFYVLWFSSICLLPFLIFNITLGKKVGVLFLTLYAIYIYVLFLNG